MVCYEYLSGVDLARFWNRGTRRSRRSRRNQPSQYAYIEVPKRGANSVAQDAGYTDENWPHDDFLNLKLRASVHTNMG
ncbi:hypothetical protein BM1_03677 [Bipolaris maydis]|nr:hypothetical protein BM1_03677 [Bipolaris maydis]